ncbi:MULTISPECIES: BCCT family transporter [Rhodococcus]|jgi:choline/carnitine/betaine transport|uniref:BCCT family transporter n=2 Tax=Nocardiaceae TaxID=85025 RepID=A0ABU4CBE0_RHOJO|nr:MULTISPECIES: BCCT family transporter [Rhodococcus]MDH6288563.1 choline/carnitine/betaine transport [Rhodococcus opacus]MDI9953129.1 BCCT family transporter [Rhodococcus sp. IEGM 1305]MDI9973477.1 BCCT family transporter [Rhodococcus sp. IEGM 1307]MDV6280858.1 BCCT family transporter [Rhodococcus jostii]
MAMNTDLPDQGSETADASVGGGLKRVGVRTDRVVFSAAAAAVSAIVVWGLVAPDNLDSTTGKALGWLVTDMGWLFVLSASGFVLFSLWLAFSKFGHIPLGKDGEKPEFRTVSWIAMMFSAGMGIGLMFFGVAEPLAHYVTPPPGSSGGIGTAMATTMFHWSLHPWAMYAVVGLSIAYGSYRKGRKQLFSSAFIPLLGRRAEGPIGKFIDVLAIFATLFGTAASLGLGALQIGSGFQVVGWMSEVSTFLLVAIVALLTLAFVASAVSGVAKGIQWLSNTNMVLAVILALFVFVVGPTVLILNLLPTTIGAYAAQLAQMSARTGASSDPATGEWLSSWTIFYWAWWISWTPFVGMFLARISRGRTIRQFVVGVIVVPSAVSLVWFAIFGGAGISEQRDGIDLAGQDTQEGQLFGMLDHLPLTGITTVLVMILVGIFFVSGADAASMVMGTLSQRGSLEPQRWVVVFWGVLTGGVAALILWTGGDTALDGLQTMTIIAAAPFVLVMIGLCFSLYKDLSRDQMIVDGREMRREMRRVAAKRRRDRISSR